MVKPVGPLMWEHRLIERIVPLMMKQFKLIDESGEVDASFVEKAADFFRV
jgi:hemerythrin-like domain-containing protein